MKIKGFVVSKKDPETFGKADKEYTKQTVVIEEDNEVEYPNRLAIDFGGDKIMFAGILNVGDLVEVFYSTRVSEKDGKAYNTIRGWRMEMIKEAEKEDNG